MLRGSFFDQNFTTDRDEVMEVFLAMDQDGNGMLTRRLRTSLEPLSWLGKRSKMPSSASFGRDFEVRS